MKQVKWHLVIGCCVALLSFIAASKALLAAANVSISYTSAAYIPPNSLVSTLSSSSGSVELANIANQEHVIGVDQQ